MEVKNIEPLIVMCKTGYLPPPSPNNVESLERWMQTTYLFENQMLEVGEEKSRNLSEANQNCCFEYNSK